MYSRKAASRSSRFALRATTAKTCTAIAARSSSTLTPDKTFTVFGRKESEYKLGKHRSNALELVQQQPVIEVDGKFAVCDGGGGALGHPLEYIKLGKRADYSENINEEAGYPCIYCGLRYRQKRK